MDEAIDKATNHNTYQMSQTFMVDVILCAQPPDSITSFARKQFPNAVIGARYPNAVMIGARYTP